MEKPTIENLEALLRGTNLNMYQRALAINEFDRLKIYIHDLEQSRICAVGQSQTELCDKGYIKDKCDRYLNHINGCNFCKMPKAN